MLTSQQTTGATHHLLSKNKIALLVLLAFAVSEFVFMRSTASASAISSYELLECTNAVRTENNQPSLYLNYELNQAARAKLEDMKTGNYWSHENPETGKKPWEFVDEAGYNYETSGENLAIGYVSGADICAAWKKSKTHLDNIVNPSFKEVGFAIEKAKIKGGGKGILVVQIFGSRKDFTDPEKLANAAGLVCDKKIDDKSSILHPDCKFYNSVRNEVVIINPDDEELSMKINGENAEGLVQADGEYYSARTDKIKGDGKYSVSVSRISNAELNGNIEFIIDTSAPGVRESDISIEFREMKEGMAEYEVSVRSADLQSETVKEAWLSIEKDEKAVASKQALHKNPAGEFSGRILVPSDVALEKTAAVKTGFADAAGNKTEITVPLPAPLHPAESRQAVDIINIVVYGSAALLVIAVIAVAVRKRRHPDRPKKKK